MRKYFIGFIAAIGAAIAFIFGRGINRIGVSRVDDLTDRQRETINRAKETNREAKESVANIERNNRDTNENIKRAKEILKNARKRKNN